MCTTIAPGNCGSWVVDATAAAICGIIAPGSESNQLPYTLPAHVVFDGIRARFPTMQLQSLQHIAALAVSSFVDVLCRAKELGFAHFANKVVSMRDPLDDQDSNRWNPLCWAVSGGLDAAVALILHGKANPDRIGSPWE